MQLFFTVKSGKTVTIDPLTTNDTLMMLIHHFEERDGHLFTFPEVKAVEFYHPTPYFTMPVGTPLPLNMALRRMFINEIVKEVRFTLLEADE